GGTPGGARCVGHGSSVAAEPRRGTGCGPARRAEAAVASDPAERPGDAELAARGAGGRGRRPGRLPACRRHAADHRGPPSSRPLLPRPCGPEAASPTAPSLGPSGGRRGPGGELRPLARRCQDAAPPGGPGLADRAQRPDRVARRRRPGLRCVAGEARLLRRVAAQSAMALVIDAPPRSWVSVAGAVRELHGFGFPAVDTVLLLATFADSGTPPAALEQLAMVALPSSQ